MELSKTLQNAIQIAAMRAKLLFDTYQWEWEDEVPTIKAIIEQYNKMVSNVWEQAMSVVGGETVGTGNEKGGRLYVEYVDEHWEFGIELAGVFDEPNEEEEEETEETKKINAVRKKLANVKQLGL